MYKKSDILHDKYILCYRKHKYRTIHDIENKRGFKLWGYIVFLNSEYSIYKKYKNSRFTSKKILLKEIEDTMNQCCNKYLQLVGGI